MGVFVNAPYDKLLRPETRFWIASPLQVSLSSEGLRTQLAPANAALAGGVEFDTPMAAQKEGGGAGDGRYVLYAGRGEAIAGGRGPQVAYDLRFAGPVGDLEEGAPVRLAGRQVGAVRDVGFSSARTGASCASR